MQKNKDFFAHKHSDGINVKMSTIGGILTFMSMINFILVDGITLWSCRDNLTTFFLGKLRLSS